MGKPVNYVPPEEVKTLLCGAGSVANQLQKLLRVVVDGTVYFSEEYKRMYKRISFAVMFLNNGRTEFGLIKYFVHDKDCDETYAVMDIPKISDSGPSFSKFAVHYVWLSAER